MLPAVPLLNTSSSWSNQINFGSNSAIFANNSAIVNWLFNLNCDKQNISKDQLNITHHKIWHRKLKTNNGNNQTNKKQYNKKINATKSQQSECFKDANITHQKIEHHKLDWKAEARTDTRNKTYTPPSKDVKKVKNIENFEYLW